MARTPSVTSYLTEADHRWYTDRIVHLVGASTPRYRAVTERLVGDLLRRWTSDGVQEDALKVEAHWNKDAAFARLPSTRLARQAYDERKKNGRGKLLYTHEHVVPIAVLLDWLFTDPKRSADTVYTHLDRFCVGALIHTSENALLKEHDYNSRMPQGWTVTPTSDPWARYKQTVLKEHGGRSLYDALDFPEDHPKRPAG